MSSAAKELNHTNISNLLAIDEEYPSPAIVAHNCRQKNWAEEHRRSVEDPAISSWALQTASSRCFVRSTIG